MTNIVEMTGLTPPEKSNTILYIDKPVSKNPDITVTTGLAKKPPINISNPKITNEELT